MVEEEKEVEVEEEVVVVEEDVVVVVDWGGAEALVLCQDSCLPQRC